MLKRNQTDMKTLIGDILVVDDNEDILLSTRLVLKERYNLVHTISNPHQIEECIQANQFDVVLLDMNFTLDSSSGREGVYWLKKIIKINPSIAVVMMTAYAEIELIVETIKLGATDFIAKPCSNSQLVQSVAAAYESAQAKKQVQNLTRKNNAFKHILNNQTTPFLGKSRAMERVFNAIDKVAKTDANVLILGESGTGKELAATSIHKASQRCDKPFVSIDMGAIPETLFESELFGHVKGAFTDAKQDRMGRIELAKEGSLFLDEIGNLPINQQIKLLATLQNQIITPIGADKSIATDVRLICATNENLQQAAEQGRFRQDLLYRINTIELHLPPLRERSDDIPLLVDYYIELYCNKYHQDIKVTPENLKLLQKYTWPGNVRELAQVVERAVILSENNTLDLSFMLNSTNQSSHAITTKTPHSFNLEQVEKETIKEAIRFYEGNMSKVAKSTGITRGALYRRLSKYGL